MLDVGDGQLVYWELSGDPEGKPAVALHGGPGSGSSPGRRRAFARHGYRLVQFDQRGCGKSTPAVSDLGTDMAANTTHHLIADTERLREHLGIDRWLVWGGSWGCTLGLAYAQRHPERVSEMVLVSVTMTRPSDIHWLYHEVGRYFPEAWARFSVGAGDAPDLVAAYDRLLNESAEPAVRVKAARDWCAWEDAVLSNVEGWVPNPRYEDAAFRMTFARTCAHYFSHAAWLDDRELLENAGRLAGIPAVLIHGRLDLGGPVDAPWLLARAWPDAELTLVGTGHQGGPEMTEHMDAALVKFAGR
jgi:proline iminopeptidase